MKAIYNILLLAILFINTAFSQKVNLDKYTYRTEFQRYAEITVITPDEYEGMNLKVILTDNNENIIKVLLSKKILSFEKKLILQIFFDELNLNTGPYYIIALWGDSCKIKKKFFLIRN